MNLQLHDRRASRKISDIPLTHMQCTQHQHSKSHGAPHSQHAQRLQGLPGNFDSKQEIQTLWEDVQQDVNRMDSSLPATRTAAPLQDPTIDVSPGWTSVTVPIRQGVSLPHLEAALRQLEPVQDRNAMFHMNTSRMSVRRHTSPSNAHRTYQKLQPYTAIAPRLQCTNITLA